MCNEQIIKLEPISAFARLVPLRNPMYLSNCFLICCIKWLLASRVMALQEAQPPRSLCLLDRLGGPEEYRRGSTPWENESWRHMPSKGSSWRGRRVIAERVLDGNCGARSFSPSRGKGYGPGGKGNPLFWVTPEEGSSPQRLEGARRTDFTLFYKRHLFKKKKKLFTETSSLPLELPKVRYFSIEMF